MDGHVPGGSEQIGQGLLRLGLLRQERPKLHRKVGFDVAQRDAHRVDHALVGPRVSDELAQASLNADALVFFDASGIQAVFPGTDMPRPEGSNIVFAPHFYDQGALFGGDVNENVRDPLAVWRDQGQQWDLPVLIGELGITAEHHQVREHALRMYEALDELGLHATWWEYSDAAEL